MEWIKWGDHCLGESCPFCLWKGKDIWEGGFQLDHECYLISRNWLWNVKILGVWGVLGDGKSARSLRFKLETEMSWTQKGSFQLFWLINTNYPDGSQCAGHHTYYVPFNFHSNPMRCSSTLQMCKQKHREIKLLIWDHSCMYLNYFQVWPQSPYSFLVPTFSTDLEWLIMTLRG